MTVKSLFFSLLLYVCLAWVGAAYLYAGPEIVHRALLWTAIGLIAVLAFVIAARLFGWWRLWRAKRSARPVTPPPEASHPDDRAMIELLAEANTALGKAKLFAGRRTAKPLSELPLYLLVGPEASGKTSTFLASGMEPQLLAGQGTMPVASTRLANIWFARRAVFAEIGGRAFAGDLERWRQLLGLLRGKNSQRFWERLWGKPAGRIDLRGVIAFCESKQLTAASSDPQRLERSIRDWQERLRIIAEVFAGSFPVYVAITNCDKIPFFPAFFRRLPESEAGQVLGCSLPAGDTGKSSSGMLAEAEARRLTASFRSLCHALAQRRLSHLAREPNQAERPGIYEFPRELRRIRSPLVQFLTDVFRPNPLAPGPVLRGYYLTGVRETEAALHDSGATPADVDTASPMETTRLFRGDATQMFQPGGGPKPPGGQRSLAFRWLFVADLFHRVVLPDRPVRQLPAVDLPAERYRRAALAAICGLCILLCGAFTWSWASNRGLLAEVRAAVDSRPLRRPPPALTDLESLEQLRVQVVRLQGDLPWPYHWGLYSGNRALPHARAAWFQRFREMLLSDWNASMIAYLDSLPANPDADAPYERVNNVLKTHLMVTSGACGVDSGLVSRVLKEYRARTAPNAGAEWQALADRQIDFYSRQLALGNPQRLSENIEARDHARQYLEKIQGIDRLYTNILAKAQKNVPKSSSLRELAPNYAQVLKGPEGVDSAFSRDGWSYFEMASKQGNSAALGEPCVMGVAAAPGIVGAWQQNAETTRTLQRKFIADYIERWRKFVEGFSVIPYNGADDAARKLEILADHKSPLLAVLALTAGQTNFPAAGTTTAANPVRKKLDSLIGSLKKTEEEVKPAPAQPADASATPADITRYFQPVHWVVPPGSETWVGEKNAAYIDALSQLQHSMREIAQAGRNPDPALSQAANQNYDKATDAVRQIAKGFTPIGVGGLDTTVQMLLEAPIRPVKLLIPKPRDAGEEANAALRAFCNSQRSTLRKYPIQSSSTEDASLNEFAGLLQPTSGAISQLQQKLADFIVKDGQQWKPKDPAKKVTPELLTFLNRTQLAADAFFANGGQPQLAYTLRPKPDPSVKDRILELEIDGNPFDWTTGLQHQFLWPPAPGTQNPGAIARLRVSGQAFPFASEGGIWGIFKIFADAEPRELGSKVVEWKYSRGRFGRPEPIQPPVQLEIVTSPGGVDVFNPKFWSGFQCPNLAAQ